MSKRESILGRRSSREDAVLGEGAVELQSRELSDGVPRPSNGSHARSWTRRRKVPCALMIGRYSKKRNEQVSFFADICQYTYTWSENGVIETYAGEAGQVAK